jgi:2-amino-4-hydroxy-6-hydroxymethyldihydropteridine diphosphokinase
VAHVAARAAAVAVAVVAEAAAAVADRTRVEQIGAPGAAAVTSRDTAPSAMAADPRPVWQPAYVGLGSNLNDPRAQVLAAVEKLRALANTRVVALSPLYGSKPFGPVKQGDFVNAVAGLLTQLDAPTLLAEAKAIERALGRPEKYERWGPRVIDLDILVYGRETRADPALTIPHPGIVERNWVLYPLADIAPSLDIPGVGRVAALKGSIAPEGLWTL